VSMTTIAARLFASALLAAPSNSCNSKYKVSLNLMDGATAPGLPALQHGINIFGVLAVLAGFAAALGGLVWIGLGKVIGVHNSGTHGRIMILGGIAGAFAVGLIVTLINWGLSQGLATSC
jgi:hypothetical protein